MKNIWLILFALTVEFSFGQMQTPVSTIGQVYNYNVGDSLEFSFSGTEIYACNYGEKLVIITAYSRQDDTITYSYKRLTSTTNVPCPNNYYGTVYGTFFDSSLITSSILNAESGIFTPYSPTRCQGLTHQQCYDSAYFTGTNNYGGKKQDEFYLQDFSATDTIWADSLGQVHVYNYIEGFEGPVTEYDLVYYHKAATGERWGSFTGFADYSVYLGVSSIADDISIVIAPNPAKSNFKITAGGLTGTTPVCLNISNVVGQKLPAIKMVNGSTVIDCSAWPAGIYIWTVTSAGSIVKNGKLIIE